MEFKAIAFLYNNWKVILWALWPSYKTRFIIAHFAGFLVNCVSRVILRCSDAHTKTLFLSLNIISCVAVFTQKVKIIPKQSYLEILSLNLNKLDRQVFGWNVINP